MKKTISLYALSSIAVMGLVACGAESRTPEDIKLPQIEEAKSSLARSTTPAISDADYKVFSKARNQTALALFKTLSSAASGNLVYSPHSVSTALAMTYAGAANTTKTQMAAALGFAQNDATLHAGFDRLDQDLGSRGKLGKGADGKAFRLNVANAIFAAKSLAFRAPFLDTLATNYGAGVKLLPYETAPEASRSTINQWVLAKTEGEIKDLLPVGSIKSDTRFTLVNAVYMNAAWAQPFDQNSTADRTFHAPTGDVTTKFMRAERTIRTANLDGGFAIELPYDKSDLSMVIAMPASGQLGAFEGALDEAAWSSLIDRLADKAVSLSLPRFRIAGEGISLVELLKKHGMNQAFTSDADFSALSDEKILVGDVLHKAMIDVGEKGTVAAAATAVIGEVTSVPQNVIAIDQPFVFAIRDIKSGTLLFVGHVKDPTAL